MRKLLFLQAFLFFFGTSIKAQTQVYGKWQVSIVDMPKNMYIDIDKDSIHVEPEILQKISSAEDSLAKHMFISYIKSNLVNGFKLMVISIEENGDIYYGTFDKPKSEIAGKYDPLKSTFTIFDENPKKNKTIPVEFQNGLMKFIYGMENNDGIIWCKSVK